MTAPSPPTLAYFFCSDTTSRVATGNATYIGSWLTMVASVPLVGLTTLPWLTAVAVMRPSIGARISV